MLFHFLSFARWLSIAVLFPLLLLPLPGESQVKQNLSTYVPVVRDSLQPANVILVINENDPSSIEIGAYYQARRGIPMQNVIRARFAPNVSALTTLEFEKLYQEIQRLTPSHAQAYALAWTRPYRVGCMSITSAFAFGLDNALCSASCGATRINPYFNSNSSRPWNDHQLRPAILLAGSSVKDVLTMIDRGIKSDYTYPAGTAYLASTEDRARNVRAPTFASTARMIGQALNVKHVKGVLRNRDDVLAYFTGLADVPGLDTLSFRPGAAADHLTSFGGQLTDSSQMSALQWLAAGATASYGTVTEPCSHPQKFPHPGTFLMHYLDGDTLIEAYWKSVAWPGEGVFVGEPLARPFGARIRMGAEGWVLEVNSPVQGRRYGVRSASSSGDRGSVVGSIMLHAGRNLVALPHFIEPVTIEPYPSLSN